MYACKNSKPQGLEESSKHELAQTDRELRASRWDQDKRGHRRSAAISRSQVSWNLRFEGFDSSIHPVSVRRFPSFRTQPLENLTPLPMKNGFLSNPAPGENLLSGNLVMETGCSLDVKGAKSPDPEGASQKLRLGVS